MASTLTTVLAVACIGLAACASTAPRAEASAPDATAHDASLNDAPTSDVGSTDAGAIDACPLLSSSAVSCGLVSGACAGCCVEDTCFAEDYPCGEGLGVCHGTSCGDRGGLGQPCATGMVADGLTYGPDGSASCIYGPWSGCTDTRAQCVDGACVHCGLSGEPCCDEGCGLHAYCDANYRCSAACGAAGQPCCQGPLQEPACDGTNACLSFGGAATCVPGSSCHADAGSCTTCGGQGQPCCADGGCNANGGGSCLGDAGCVQVHMR
jgi:hypothetical protein